MIVENIQNLLETVIPDYLDVISIIKLELTCKRYQKPNSFWLNRLKQKYELELLDGANAKDYAVMIELMYTYDELSMSKYLKWLAKSSLEQKESIYSFTYWDNERNCKRSGNKLIRANNNYEAMSKFFCHCPEYIYKSYQYLINNPHCLHQDRIHLMPQKPITAYVDYLFAEEIHMRFHSLKDIVDKLLECFINRDYEINLIVHNDIV